MAPSESRPSSQATTFRPTWESVAWVALVLVASILRLRHLGVRVFTHDESIHAYYSLTLLSGGYQHDPAYHGPFLYHVNAVVYQLLGASDFTARLIPALVGVALVAVLWLFRRYLGRAGALLAAAFVTLSPTLVFYSRYLRNDIYVALFTLLWIYGTCRYLESRQRRWLYLVTLSMAFSFVTKEVSFISGAIVGLYCLALALWPSGSRHSTGRKRSAGDLSILMLTLVLPFPSGFGHATLAWHVRDPHTEAAIAVRGGLLVGLLFAMSSIIACAWFAGPRRDREGLPLSGWAGMMALFWMVQAFFFTTFFTNIRGGLVSGIVGSLGYWLGQQEVGRGDQPCTTTRSWAASTSSCRYSYPSLPSPGCSSVCGGGGEIQATEPRVWRVMALRRPTEAARAETS